MVLTVNRRRALTVAVDGRLHHNLRINVIRLIGAPRPLMNTRLYRVLLNSVVPLSKMMLLHNKGPQQGGLLVRQQILTRDGTHKMISVRHWNILARQIATHRTRGRIRHERLIAVRQHQCAATKQRTTRCRSGRRRSRHPTERRPHGSVGVLGGR